MSSEQPAGHLLPTIQRKHCDALQQQIARAASESAEEVKRSWLPTCYDPRSADHFRFHLPNPKAEKGFQLVASPKRSQQQRRLLKKERVHSRNGVRYKERFSYNVRQDAQLIPMMSRAPSRPTEVEQPEGPGPEVERPASVMSVRSLGGSSNESSGRYYRPSSRMALNVLEKQTTALYLRGPTPVPPTIEDRKRRNASRKPQSGGLKRRLPSTKVGNNEPQTKQFANLQFIFCILSQALFYFLQNLPPGMQQNMHIRSVKGRNGRVKRLAIAVPGIRPLTSSACPISSRKSKCHNLPRIALDTNIMPKLQKEKQKTAAEKQWTQPPSPWPQSGNEVCSFFNKKQARLNSEDFIVGKTLSLDR